MSHFAKLDENNVVVFVTVGRQEDEGLEAELTARTGDTYKQTSYKTRGGVHYDPETGEPYADQSKAFRGNFAGIGFTYLEAEDIFMPPKPYESWVLDTTCACWLAPVDMPDDGQEYVWDESAGEWVVSE